MQNSYARYNAPMVAVAAALMLYFGWGTGGWLYPAGASEFYVFTLNLFDWMLRVGGMVMAVVAAVCFLGQRIGLLLETIVSGICGAIMVGCSAVWILSYGIGFNQLLVVIFGFMFISAARSAFRLYTDSKMPVPAAAAPARPVEPAAPHPASLASPVLPKNGEPPPEEGYLAALSKEKDDA